MSRAPYVIAGTVAGIAGVLAFPTHKIKLHIPGGTALGAARGTTTTTPTTAEDASPSTSAAAGGVTTPGAAAGPATTAPPTTVPSLRKANGGDQQYPYGVLSVVVTVKGNKITDLSIGAISETDGRSVQIDQIAIPQLRQEVLAAQSTNINGVSGATYTSQAYVNSVQAALDQLGVK